MKYIFGNQKMNLSPEKADKFITDFCKSKEMKQKYWDIKSKDIDYESAEYKEFENQVKKRDKKRIKPIFDDLFDVVIFPSLLNLQHMKNKSIKLNKRIGFGAQNCYLLDEGAYTGEISASQLAGTAEFVLVGHSERRQIFNETDKIINLKIKSIIKNGMAAVLCVGETAGERADGQTEKVIARQLKDGLEGLNPKKLNRDFIEQKLIIAYEPVWSIGSGKTPTDDEIAKTIKFIHKKVVAKVVYGGSVTPENTAKIMKISGVDGLLVGNASTNAIKFATIVKTAREGQ